MEKTQELTLARAQMLIRMPVRDVFEAFVDPKITSKFWFTSSTGRLEAGKKVKWTWAMYNVSTEVFVLNFEKDRRIAFEWGDSADISTVELDFSAVPGIGTFVRISVSGADAPKEELLNKAIDQTGGWNLVLAALKAYLEHGLTLKVVADHHPPEVKR